MLMRVILAGLDSGSEKESLNGITKVVKAETGVSGDFLYFVKIVLQKETSCLKQIVIHIQTWMKNIMP